MITTSSSNAPESLSVELKEIKNGLKENQDEIESAIDTIDLQLEAMGKNENFIEYTDKKV